VSHGPTKSPTGTPRTHEAPEGVNLRRLSELPLQGSNLDSSDPEASRSAGSPADAATTYEAPYLAALLRYCQGRIRFLPSRPTESPTGAPAGFPLTSGVRLQLAAWRLLA
jgi:hypothetical protein